MLYFKELNIETLVNTIAISKIFIFSVTFAIMAKILLLWNKLWKTGTKKQEQKRSMSFMLS